VITIVGDELDPSKYTPLTTSDVHEIATEGDALEMATTVPAGPKLDPPPPPLPSVSPTIAPPPPPM
jgi:hypothetical protein